MSSVFPLLSEVAIVVSTLAAAVSARASSRSVQLGHRPYVYGEPVFSSENTVHVTLHNDGPGTATEVICRLVSSTDWITDWSPSLRAMQGGEVVPPPNPALQPIAHPGFSFVLPKPDGSSDTFWYVETQFGSITGARWRVLASRTFLVPTVIQRIRSGRLDVWLPRGDPPLSSERRLWSRVMRQVRHVAPGS
jgi:hypothetical protein